MKEKMNVLKKRLLCFVDNNSYLFLAFIVPVVIMWMIYIALEVFPFGNNSVLVLDLNGQYVNFFDDLKHKILDSGSMLYTWTRTLGGEFMGIFAYYLSSPFSFLVALFPDNNMTEALLLIILLKAGSMGATMAYYLNESHPTKKLNIIIFSSCYALSAFAVVMAHNTMWIDCMILLPLVTLGIERLIKKGAFKLFVFSLAMSLLTSFYIGYMICIYVAIYFFYYYLASSSRYGNNFWLEDNHFFKSLLRIICYSAIAISIAMIIILPAYTSLQFGKDEFTNPNFTFTQRFDWLDLLVKLYPGSYDSVRPEGLPFIYAGSIVLLLFPMYFITSRISWRERMMGGAILIVFLLSFNVNALDIVWHGFQKPNWLNYRYAFIFAFLLIVMAYKAFGKLHFANYKHVVFIGGVLTLLIFIMQKLDYKNVKDIKTVWFSVLCIGAFCVALWFVYKQKYRGMATAVIAILVFAELFTAGLMNAIALDEDVVMSSRDSYNHYMNAVRPAVQFVKDYDDSEFYRMEKNFHRQNNGRTNDPMTLDFYGISNSTSTLNKASINLLHRYGYASRSHWSQYLGGTPVADAILGIKYVISNTEIDNQVWQEIGRTPVDDLYRDYVIKKPDELIIYENPYALSLAFASSFDAANVEITDFENPFLLMNAMATAFMGSDEEIEIFEKLKIKDTEYININTNFATNHRKYSAKDSSKTAEIEMIVKVPAGEPVYFYVPTDYPRECALYVNGTNVGNYMGNKTDCVYYLGIFDEEQEISVKLRLKDDPIYVRTKQDYFFTLNSELFAQTFETLANGNLSITKFEEDYIEGTVNVSEGQSLLFTTITFDEGWIIKVDGKTKDLIKTNDGLIAVEIEEGTHKVTFTYRPKCYVNGSILSALGIAAFAGAIAYDEFKKIRDRKRWAKENNIF